jgi:hypothetical protein
LLGSAKESGRVRTFQSSDSEALADVDDVRSELVDYELGAADVVGLLVRVIEEGIFLGRSEVLLFGRLIAP